MATIWENIKKYATQLGFTYNEAGKTYNEVGVNYRGKEETTWTNRTKN